MEEKGIKNVEYGSYYIRFTWKIQNFSTIKAKFIDSDVFTGGDHKWKIRIYPKALDAKGDNLSIFLHPVDTATFPNGWTRPVKFSLSVISEVDDHTFKIESNHAFKSNSGWGYSSFMALNKLRDVNQRFLVSDTCTVRAEVWFNEEKDKEPSIDLKPVQNSTWFSKFDSLFTDIQNCMKEKSANSCFEDNEIGDAQTILKRCLNMDLTSLIRSGKAPELKNALSLLLTAKALPDSAIDETEKFVANLDQRCKKFETAKRDLSEAQEAEDSVDELQTTLKQLSSKFMPVRNQAEAIDSEIERLAEQLEERKAKRERLRKKLDELAEQATTSKQALLNAEKHMKLTTFKKSEADKVLSEFQISWESLKDLHLNKRA